MLPQAWVRRVLFAVRSHRMHWKYLHQIISEIIMLLIGPRTMRGRRLLFLRRCGGVHNILCPTGSNVCCICLHLALCKIICTLASRTPTYSKSSTFKIEDSRFLYVWCWGSRDVSRIGSHHSKECCVWILSGGAKATAWKSKGPATAAGRGLSKERAGTIIPTTPCVQVHQIQWATSRGNWFLSSLQLVPSWIDGLLYVDGVT